MLAAHINDWDADQWATASAAFVFLLTGVVTNYISIRKLRDTTKTVDEKVVEHHDDTLTRLAVIERHVENHMLQYKEAMDRIDAMERAIITHREWHIDHPTYPMHPFQKGDR